MEAMQVYHLTIQEDGHSRRFVYETEAFLAARCLKGSPTVTSYGFQQEGTL